ncbi:MAG TPA: MFS transporter [Paenibacillus sp.]|uniref:MFS transporter n=1 Tax=Paenibacillus sp. TaxID=58172 RepID=UPI0028D1B774|nr:MFS transporter [Paenibacillus sp.]HUC92435.1 MFS transporter [Paenibacillus sp.]
MINPRSFIQQLKAQMGPQAWHNFRIDALAAATFSVFNVVFNQFYIPMALRAGATDLQVGLLAAAPAIGLLFSPIWASWIERTSPKPFVIVPNLIGRALIVLPAFYGAPIVFVAAALLFHLLMGIQAPAYPALITRIYPANLRGRLMGNVRVAMGALMIPLAYLIGRWLDYAGAAGPLLAASATGILSILFLIGVRESEAGPARPVAVKRASLKDQLGLVKQNRELSFFLAASTLSGFANLFSQPLYNMIQVEYLQLSNAQLGYARAAYFGCLLLAYLAVGWVIDRISAKKSIVYGLLAYSLVPLLYGLFGNYASVLVGSGIQGVGDAIWDIGIMAYLFRLAPGREAVVFGLHMMLFGVRGTIGPLLSTALLAQDIPMAGLLIGASLFSWAGVAVFLLLAARDRAAAA